MAWSDLNPFASNPGTAPTYGGQYQVPHYQEDRNLYRDLSWGYAGRDAPQARAFTAGNSDFRRDQRSFGRQLAAEAQGRGVGQQVVRMQAQDMADRGAQQQLAMAASGRPGGGAQAYQNAAFNAGNMQSQVGGQAALAGGQMQLGAMNQYGGFLQGARGQDQQLSMFNAGQQQQGSQFNVDATLRQRGMNDQAQLEALRQRMGLTGMQQQSDLAYAGAQQNYNLARMQQPTMGQQMLGAAGGLAGGYMQYRAGTGGAGAGGSQPYSGAGWSNGTAGYGYQPYNPMQY